MTQPTATATGPYYDFDSAVGGPVLGVPPLAPPLLDPPQLAPLAKPLPEATVGLLVTCGAYYPDQERMRQTNDLSYRLLPRDRDLSDILFAHMTPIRAFGLADPNVAYPRDSMLDLERQGVFAHYADNAVSMVGSITDYDALAKTTAPRIVDELRAMNVDLLLTMPYCPQCHSAAGVLARAIEELGMPTTSLTTLYKTAQSVKPPRATFLDFPLGCPGGRPREKAQQRDIVRQALQTAAAVSPDEPWSLQRLPFSWEADGSRDWESLVTDVYRVDNEIRGTVMANMQAHDFKNVAGAPGEGESGIRCAC